MLMHKNRTLFYLIFGVGVFFWVSLVAQTSAIAGKTLVYCSEGDPDDLSPALARTTTGADVLNPVFDTLVQYDVVTQEILPKIAESWTVSDDGLIYTFKLRANVAFHTTDQFTPSRTLTAKDVVFSFHRQWQPEHPYHKIGGSTHDNFNELSMSQVLKSIDVVDDLTVRFTLTRQLPSFLTDLSVISNAITSADYGEQMLQAGTPEQFDQAPVGTGPFQMVVFRKGTTVRYRAFENHWRGRPPLDTLVFAITPNAAIRLNKLQAGECHLMPFPNVTDLPKIEADTELKLMELPADNVAFIALNVQKKPFDDVRVRRAVNMAIDKKTLVEAIYGRAGLVAKNPIPPASWGHNNAIVDYPYDPEGAIKLLAAAGYSAGFEIELAYIPIARPYMPNGKRAAEMIRNDLARVGIGVNLVTDAWSVYSELLIHGQQHASMDGWIGASSEPIEFLGLDMSCEGMHDSGINAGAKWCNQQFDDLIMRATLTSDKTQSRPLYFQSQEVFKRDAPWVPLAHAKEFVVLRKQVLGLQIGQFGTKLFHAVDLAD